MESQVRRAPELHPMTSADLAALRTRLRQQRSQVRSRLTVLRDAQNRIGHEVAILLAQGFPDQPGPAAPQRHHHHIEGAEAMLRRLLAAGPLPTIQVRVQAGRAGISDRTLARARRRLGVRAVRVGGFAGRGSWYCRLP
jgi:hypothetical protein